VAFALIEINPSALDSGYETLSLQEGGVMTSTGSTRRGRPDKVTLIAVWCGINAAISLLAIVPLFVFQPENDQGLVASARGFGYFLSGAIKALLTD
jgi:hypothetical protein